jgi:hypothetical protein
MVGSGIAAAQPPAPSPPAGRRRERSGAVHALLVVGQRSERIVAHNWQISTTTSFAQRVAIDSTMGETQDTVSGLANGTYFWRVQAVNNQFQQGPWSAPQSFTVTEVAPAPGISDARAAEGLLDVPSVRGDDVQLERGTGRLDIRPQAATDQNFPVASRIQLTTFPTRPTRSRSGILKATTSRVSSPSAGRRRLQCAIESDRLLGSTRTRCRRH